MCVDECQLLPATRQKLEERTAPVLLCSASEGTHADTLGSQTSSLQGREVARFHRGRGLVQRRQRPPLEPYTTEDLRQEEVQTHASAHRGERLSLEETKNF